MRTIGALDHAFDLLHTCQADPLADKAFEPELIRSDVAAEALAPRANDRERTHIAAVRADNAKRPPALVWPARGS